jgi:hypothetical protein
MSEWVWPPDEDARRILLGLDIDEGGSLSATASVSGAPQLDASALSSQKQDQPITVVTAGKRRDSGTSRKYGRPPRHTT